MIDVVIFSALILFLIWVSVHDIKTHRIENFSHFVIITISFFINDLSIAERLLGCLFCFIPLFIANIISRNGIGMGDVKLAGSMGFFLGYFHGMNAVIIGLIFMLLITGIYQKIKHISKAIPLAPYLCGGFAFCLILQIGKDFII